MPLNVSLTCPLLVLWYRYLKPRESVLSQTLGCPVLFPNLNLERITAFEDDLLWEGVVVLKRTVGLVCGLAVAPCAGPYP